MRDRLVLFCCMWVLACSSNNSGVAPGRQPTPAPSNATYDVDALGIPRIATNNYIDLAEIARTSKFRSSEGHDYHDDFETCRSLKHYFQPKAGADWSAVRVYAPVRGTIELTRQDLFGLQIVIRSTASPAFAFIVFHVNPVVSVNPGTPLEAGQMLGTHIGAQTMSDIAVSVNTPAGYKLVSWFDVMSDAVFQQYAARGVASRASAIITRAARDLDPLACDGETFTTHGTLESWLVLN